MQCPGAVKVFCAGEADEVPLGGLDPADADDRCQCDGELFINPDCTIAGRCRRFRGSDYILRNEVCTGGEFVKVDFLTWETSCDPDPSNCPGLGGLSLGCQVYGIRQCN